MSDNTKIIIIENVPLDDILSPEEAFRDLLFFSYYTWWRVRNKAEFAALIKNSGLNLLNIMKTSSSYSIIECNKLK